MRPGVALTVAGVAVAAGAAVLYRFDPATAALFPPCPFHILTDLHCPGCGSLRALRALLHGEWLVALGFNALTTLGAPFLVAGVARESYRLARGTDPVRARVPAWAIWTLLVVLLAFAALRNLPAFAWLAPG